MAETNGKAERFVQTSLGEWAYGRRLRQRPEQIKAARPSIPRLAIQRKLAFSDIRPATQLGKEHHAAPFLAAGGRASKSSGLHVAERGIVVEVAK